MPQARKMKKKEQIKILENEFIKDRNWSKKKIIYLAKILGLSECQVYKWNWDQKLAERKYIYETFYSGKCYKKDIFRVEKVRSSQDIFTVERV